MSVDLSCATCRAIRRFLFAFVVGGLVAWKLGINIPYENTVGASGSVAQIG